MDDDLDLSRLARTIGEPTRIRMLALLMAGRALTAKELAYGAGVEPATASAHLQRLGADGFIEAAAQGRHKYFRLASPQVAQLIEALMALALPAALRGTRPPHGPICDARFCYDHLAGRLGTGLSDTLLQRRLLQHRDGGFALSAAGERWCEAFGIELAPLRRARRRFAHPCLDWSERRDHLGGALGAALAQRLLDLNWIERNRHSRVVNITVAGHAQLAQQFGFSLEPQPSA